MHLDCREYPNDYTYAAIVGKELGLYVKVAQFVEHNGSRVFRMIVDPEIDKKQMRELLFSTIKDKHGAYEFAYLETIAGPIVDDTKHLNIVTSYIRITFM